MAMTFERRPARCSSPALPKSRRNRSAKAFTRSRNSASSSSGAGKLTSQEPAPPRRDSTKSNDCTMGLLARKFLLKSVSTRNRRKPMPANVTTISEAAVTCCG